MSCAIILAGGLGTRLARTVPDLPKSMAPISGRPFLAHQLDYWIAQGIAHFVLSLGFRHERIVDYFGHAYQGATLDYVIEKTPLGTGGGLLLAAERVGNAESFLLLNGDTYFTVDLRALIAFAMANDADWCLTLFRTHEEGRYMGIDLSQQGQIISLKASAEQAERLVNGGIYWVHPRALRQQTFLPGDSVSLEDELLPKALALGQRLLGMESAGLFIDIGVPDDYYRANKLLTRANIGAAGSSPVVQTYRFKRK